MVSLFYVCVSDIVAWLPYELSKGRKSLLHIGTIFTSLILSAFVLSFALLNPDIAPDENKILHAQEYAEIQEVDKKVARFLDVEMQDVVILMDSSTAFYRYFK